MEYFKSLGSPVTNTKRCMWK